jgi:hypothetical protein
MSSKRSNNPNDSLNLDSFMDIVTNVIGTLFFVIVYAALSSFSATGKVTIPQIVTSETEAIIFECRDNTILEMDSKSLKNELVERIKYVKTTSTSLSSLFSQIMDIKVSNQYYDATLNIINSSIIVTAKEGIKGESSNTIKKENSLFQKKLLQLDSQKHHIYFFVRSNSFEIFHVARKIALKNGFGAGWNPFNDDDIISFGSGGIALNKQT